MNDASNKSQTKPKNPSILVFVFLFLLIMVVSGLAYYTYDLNQKISEGLIRENKLQTQISNLETEKKATDNTIAMLTEELEDANDELDELEDDYRDERDRNEEFEDQLDSLAGTVGALDKLSKTDKELLQKYSKVYFLNENFIPSDLDEIRSKYILEGKKDQYFHADALEFLEDLIDDARDDDHDLFIVSAYRSFDEQDELKGQFTQTYGSGANTFSADQGYSEHQLGTTVDLTVTEVGGAYTSFATTEAYQWLLDNAYKYGFVLSYPEGNNFYIFEPWHWRFVGVDLARDLHRDDTNFYDWEQRKIDEYLIKIFD